MTRHPMLALPIVVAVTSFAARPPLTQHAASGSHARAYNAPPRAIVVSPADAKDILKKAADNLAKAHSLHFKFTATAVTPGSRFSSVVAGDGTLVLPGRLVFSGQMQMSPALAMPFVSAMCDADQYVEFGDGNFQKMPGAPNVHRLLFSGDSGFVSGVLTQLEDVSAPKRTTLGDVATWQISGTVPEKLLAVLPHGPSPAKSAGPIHAEVWIGQHDGQLHQLVVSGPMFEGDSTNTVRTLTFSQFNESLPLTVPRGKLPCSTK